MFYFSENDFKDKHSLRCDKIIWKFIIVIINTYTCRFRMSHDKGMRFLHIIWTLFLFRFFSLFPQFVCTCSNKPKVEFSMQLLLGFCLTTDFLVVLFFFFSLISVKTKWTVITLKIEKVNGKSTEKHVWLINHD